MVDAKDASEAAVEYFRTVAGTTGPLGFSVQRAERQGDAWLVECSYFEFFGARERSAFLLEVEADSGKVRRVQKLAAVPPP